MLKTNKNRCRMIIIMFIQNVNCVDEWTSKSESKIRLSYSSHAALERFGVRISFDSRGLCGFLIDDVASPKWCHQVIRKSFFSRFLVGKAP
jgi:hypothetical protein